jgi:predicted negative regulator of RcsB-dependent stress response
MAKKKVTRKELLKKPDEFLTFSSKAFNVISSHQHQLTYLGVALAVIVIAYLAVHAYFGYINKKGQDAYNTACYALAQDMKPSVDPEELKRAIELFEKVTDQYGLSKAARLALPPLTYLKFLEKKYDEGVALQKEFLNTVSGETQYESLGSLALAACYEAEGDLKAAIETLDPVMNRAYDPFKEAAMLSLARLYRLDNKPERAKEILKEFVEEYKDSPFLPLAKARL